MLILYIKAPFAACRPFVAGTYRPTAPFITYTAAYGLLMNLAGIETRDEASNTAGDKSLATLMRHGLPVVRLALGALVAPDSNAPPRPLVCSLYQQLHNYPVRVNKARWAHCRGAKYNIQPVRREILVGVEGYVALDAADIEAEVRRGLTAGLSALRPDGRPRYGVPFMGDNSYLLDIAEEVPNPRRAVQPARWYCPLDQLPDIGTARADTCRMTTWIHRREMARTRSALFAPGEASAEVPAAAWLRVGPEPEGGS